MTGSAPGQPAAPAGVPSGTGDRVRAEITWAIKMGRKAVAEQTHYTARPSATARAALDDLDTRLEAGGYLTFPAEVMPFGHAIETACTRLRHACRWLQQTEDLAAILGITVPDDWRGAAPARPGPAAYLHLRRRMRDHHRHPRRLARYWQAHDEHTDGDFEHYTSETVTDRFGTRHWVDVTEVTGDDGVFWCEDCCCYRDHGDGDPHCPGCTAAQHARSSGGEDDGEAGARALYRLSACGETAYAQGPR